MDCHFRDLPDLAEFRGTINDILINDILMANPENDSP